MLSLAQLLLTLTVAPLLAGVAIVAIGPRWSRRAALGLAVIVVVIMAIAAILIGGDVLPVAPQLVTLISFGSVGLVHRLDDFSAALIIGIAFWVTPILLWMTAPRGPSLNNEPASPRAMGWVLIAASLALSAVLVDNVFLIALCWGGAGLVGWLIARPESNMAPGSPDEWLDLALFTLGPILFGLAMIYPAKINSTSSLYDMTGQHAIGFGAGIVLIIVLAFAAGMYPFIIWVRRVAQGVLPEAAGVLLLLQTPLALVMLARMITLMAFKGTWPIAHIGPATFTLNSLALILGVITIIVCGFVLLFERDLLAFTGFLNALILGWGFIAIGTGDQRALVGLVFVLLAQTLGIGTLLAVWSSFEWANRDLQVRDLVGMARDLPGHFAAMLLAALSLVGMPLLAGFAAMATIDQSLLSEGGTAALGGAIIWIGNGLALVGVGRLLIAALGTPQENAEGSAPVPPPWEGIVLVIPVVLLVLMSVAPELLLIKSPGLLGPVARVATALAPYASDFSTITVSPLGFTAGDAVWIPGAFWALAVALSGVAAISAGIFGPETLPSPVYAGGELYDPSEDDTDADFAIAMNDVAKVARSPWFLPGPALWRSDIGEPIAATEEDADDDLIIINEEDVEILDDDAEEFDDDVDETPSEEDEEIEFVTIEADEAAVPSDVDDEEAADEEPEDLAAEDVETEEDEPPGDDESAESGEAIEGGAIAEDEDTVEESAEPAMDDVTAEDEPPATNTPTLPRNSSSTPRPARTSMPARNVPPGAGANRGSKGGKRGKPQR
jgi:formate hydrogenlyase subunit 3/multisubunit Na+/H+ antiporter MnhD subunit